MPSLKKMLQSYDLDLIERIGSTWGAELANLDQASAVEALLKTMTDDSLLTEILESLPQSAREAWENVTRNTQKITWAQFSRKYGEVREFGPAKREREAPERHPATIAETLWYRGLIGRAFMNLPPEPREFVFVPDELCPVKGSDSTLIPASLQSMGAEPEKVFPADSRLLDHATDWLAARRKGADLPVFVWQNWPENERFITELAKASKLVDQNLEPAPDALADFFQKGRNEILLQWIEIWNRSTRYNDLKALPGLVFEGNWKNDPAKPRTLLIEILQTLTIGEWYSLADLTASIKIHQPDFQRPSGDYDSWFIRSAESGDYLRGFTHWDEVDGAVIKHIMTGTLHWLGMVDLGLVNKNTCFRLTNLFSAYSKKTQPPMAAGMKTAVQISPDLSFTIPILSSRTLRYQIARFCELQSASANETTYQITSASMSTAQQNGLKPLQLVQLLERQLKKPLPRSLKLLAEKWEKTGRAVLFEKQLLLRTQNPEILSDLQNDTHTARFIIEILSPTTAVINPTGMKVIKKSLLEQGLLAEVNLNEDES